METLELLGADQLRDAMTAYRDALRRHQEAINRLNVYPVPDGDTGTNMALTLEAVVSELEGSGADAPPMRSTCDAIAHGSLMGARGNSGVILSQMLRGISEVFRHVDGAGPSEVARALAAGSDGARSAVMRPVEGTILTVASCAADASRARAESGSDLLGVLDAAKAAAADALDRTPEQLPVLREAGVVDAGGAGFVLLLDALLLVAAGRPLPEPPVNLAPVVSDRSPRAPREPVGECRYEVMYLLEAPDDAVPAFRDVWAGIGDSIVVVGGDGLWNCHIHTGDIGAAVEAALDAGRPREIRVTDLAEQVEEERWVREAPVSDLRGIEADSTPVATAVVAVATGEGVRRIFHSLGVHQIVAGGQSMNPSTAQILEAVEAAPSDDVVVLPNNDNIIPVAEQVGGLTTKDVRVVKTSGIAQGFAALLEYDPEATGEANLAAMSSAAGRVMAGEVTRAVRDSRCDAGPISAGDWIGLSAAGIEAVSGTVAGAACDLLDKLVGPWHEIVTVIEGDGSSPADTRRIREWLTDRRPEITVEVHHGGQPLYPYLFSIE